VRKPIEDISVLYVEDEDRVREGMACFLRNRFEQVYLGNNGREGLDMYRRHTPDIVITDVRMPVMDGVALTRNIRNQDTDVCVIVTTAYNDTHHLIDLINLGISHYVMKPLEHGKLNHALTACVSTIRNRKRSDELQDATSVAYRSINAIIDCGEMAANQTVPLNGSLEQNQNNMIEALLCGGGGGSGPGPEILVMANNIGTAESTDWCWYELRSTGIHCKYCYREPPALNPANSGSDPILYCVNVDDPLPADPLLRRFIGNVAVSGERPRNLVWYRNGSHVVCTLNYPCRVTPFDAAMVKGLAVQSLYLKNLSNQIQATEDAFAYTITSLARAAEANDEDTGNHIVRVGEFCAAIAGRMGFPEIDAAALKLQSRLHDVGKIHVPVKLLKKPGRLTNDEMQAMRGHTLFGARIIGDHPRLEIASKVALYHHERWDGSGYPYGLSTTRIPLEARILSVADTYDALRSARSYKPAYDHDLAFHIICNGDDRTRPEHFDPEVLRAFRELESTIDAIYRRFASPPISPDQSPRGVPCRSRS
jgi:response regulator RpfG family c-di-GMP phosphodiesterase